MYGTVARLRVKPGNETQMTAVSREYDQEPIAGAVASYLFQADTDAHEFYLMAVFESQETYRANAGSPAQHAPLSQAPGAPRARPGVAPELAVALVTEA